MAKKFPIHPPHPERVCWGCDKYCPADDMACGNGSDRTQHPVELFGDDWMEWSPLDDKPAVTDLSAKSETSGTSEKSAKSETSGQDGQP
ncbi:MAG: DUF3079 domain-containing protein [Rubrivivax sp.]